MPRDPIVQASYVANWRVKTKMLMVEAMGGSCVCCGYKKSIRALEFHHLDPSEKDFSFGRVTANPKAWSSVIVELRKCVLVCGNCHCEIHEGLREVPANAARFNETFVVKPNYRKATAEDGRKRFDWSGIDVLALLAKESYASVATSLGISPGAVYKRVQTVRKQEHATASTQLQRPT